MSNQNAKRAHFACAALGVSVTLLLGSLVTACQPEASYAVDPTATGGRVTFVTGGRGGSQAGGAGGASTGDGGSGGQSNGGATGRGGSSEGGSGGAVGGSSGRGGAGGGDTSASGGRDTSQGGTSGKDAGRGTDADAGPVSCSDTTSYGRLGVYYYSDSAATGSSIQIHLDLVNFTALSARLSDVTVRYWFTDETPSLPNVMEQYYVPIPTTMKFIALNPPREGADTVLEMSYPKSGDAGGSFVETRGFNFAFHKESYAGTYNQADDYSYDPKLKSALGQNPRITAYINGALAWGCEPSVLPPPPVDAGEPAVDGGASADAPISIRDAAALDGGTVPGDQIDASASPGP
jgi:hypothetical protein